MAMLIENPRLEEELIGQRKSSGTDHHDEVWEGVYFMPPMANTEHQQIILRFSCVLGAVVDGPGLGMALPGANLAASAENWEHDYRVPDVVVFLADTAAKNHDAFWTGAADFVIEITSPRDRTYEKLPFYSRIGVCELLIVNRQPWAIELYWQQDGSLRKTGESTIERSDVLASQKLPLAFRLIPGPNRPQIEVRHTTTGERWMV
jgi:Uma2 family endonuclease